MTPEQEQYQRVLSKLPKGPYHWTDASNSHFLTNRLVDAADIAYQESGSELIQIFRGSARELANLNLFGFRKRLQQDFKLDYLDMALVHTLSTGYLDRVWNNDSLLKGNKPFDTKRIGLPALIIYEYLAKQKFGIRDSKELGDLDKTEQLRIESNGELTYLASLEMNNRRRVDRFFSAYGRIMQNPLFNCDRNVSELEEYAMCSPERLWENCSLGDLSFMSDEQLKTGKFKFQNHPISSQAQVRALIETKITDAIINYFVTEDESEMDSDLLTSFQEMLREAAQLKDQLWTKNNDSALGDWFQEAGIFFNCGSDLAKYRSKAELKVKPIV